MTLNKADDETGLNLHGPQYAGWRDPNSDRNFRAEIASEERAELRKIADRNAREHEELRLRVERLERNESQREPVIEAASTMVAASKLMKAAIVVLAVLLSVMTGALQLFDKWLSK